jgi:pyruvate dehydrogenase E1 component beta subunit
MFTGLAHQDGDTSVDAPVQRLAGLDMSIPFDGALEAATIPQVPDIVAAARRIVSTHARQ